MRHPEVLATSLAEEEFETIQDLLDESETDMRTVLKEMGIKAKSTLRLMHYLDDLGAAQAAAAEEMEEVKALRLSCFYCTCVTLLCIFRKFIYYHYHPPPRMCCQVRSKKFTHTQVTHSHIRPHTIVHALTHINIRRSKGATMKRGAMRSLRVR